MKRPVLLILGVALGLAGCGGNSSSSQSAAAQATAAAQPTAAASVATAGGGNPTDLPLYPGATKSAFAGSGITLKKCGYVITTTMYDLPGSDSAAVANWYASRIPGGIRFDNTQNMGSGASVKLTEIFEPSGAGGAGVAYTNMGSIPVPKTGPAKDAAGLHLILVSYNPALSPDLMQDVQAMMGSDQAAKQAAMARIKAKCGAGSVPVGT